MVKDNAGQPRTRILLSKWFARQECIGEETLISAVLRAESGQIDADLGGGVIKQRLARAGQVRSGGYRTIIFFRNGHRAVFMFGFPKSSRPNLTASEQRLYRESAAHVLNLPDKQLDQLIKSGDFLEVPSP